MPYSGENNPSQMALMSRDPESLTALLDQLQTLVRRAYSDGFQQGAREAVDKMTRAANVVVDQRVPSLLTGTTPPHPSAPAVTAESTPSRKSPPRVGLEGAPRQFGYGVVIATLRHALLMSRETGITKDEMIQFCRARGVDVTANTVKDAMKRLTGGEEMERHAGAYFPGPRLKDEIPLSGAKLTPQTSFIDKMEKH